MAQFGFFVDLSRCIGCNGCVIACKQWHDIPPGPVKWMRVYQWESGSFPHTRIHLLPIMCYHCENPVCARACPHNALACPYGTPQFETDAVTSAKMSKCNMCIERLKDGLKPICVLSCSMRALEFGPLDEIIGKYGNQRKIEGMPKETITRPAVVFKSIDPKRQVVPWDPRRALELWQKRNSPIGEQLPEVFSEITDVTQAPVEIVGRNKLVLKAKSIVEMMYYTIDDE
jgi:anaerobic dimethyl sulfoxide reductase subunit B (iron-sulfur subunit)